MHGKITVSDIREAKTAEFGHIGKHAAMKRPAASLGKNEGAPAKRPAAATRRRPACFDGDADAE
eukprot:4088329-Pyramimonas_sp.AAC.1